MTVAVLPPATTVGELGRVGTLSVGVMSAGIGSVPAEQTYLDVSQGNRVPASLYEDPLTRSWRELVDRAESAPAEIVPGLLASSLLARGIPVRAAGMPADAALIAADRRGVVRRGAGGAGLQVLRASLGSLPGLIHRLRGDDLLIAFAAPPPPPHGTLPIGVAGAGFEGALTSDSTRTEGYVVSSDLAPTILRRFGVSVPGEMNGEPIRGEGTADPAGVSRRAERMSAIPKRRAPVLVACLGAWIAIAASIALLARRRGALAWLALAFAYLPLMLLAGAAIQPGALVEGLLVGIGAAALAALTGRLLPGWWALAVACAVSVLAYAVDMVGGSELTKLSLLGPNPVYGARFYGIGNELEALFAVMVPAGVGAALTAAGAGRMAAGERKGGTAAGEGRGISSGAARVAFLAAGFAAAFVFGPGRLGADVGAAIVLPLGAVVAAAALPSNSSSEGFSPHTGQDPSRRGPNRRRRVVTALIGTPLVAVAVLALIDLVSGANAHLSRSVLDAGGAGSLADALQRRLELSAHDFGRAAADPLFWLLIAGVVLSIFRWRRIDARLRRVPAVRAALLGGCAAVAAGTLANDSGAAYLALGVLAIGAFLAFAWAQGPARPEMRVMRETGAGKY